MDESLSNQRHIVPTRSYQEKRLSVSRYPMDGEVREMLALPKGMIIHDGGCRFEPEPDLVKPSERESAFLKVVIARTYLNGLLAQINGLVPSNPVRKRRG